MSTGTRLRLLTAAILIPAVVAAAWWGPTWFVAALGGIVAVLALLEFFALGARMGFHAYKFWTCLAALGIFAQQWQASQASSISTLGDLLSEVHSPHVTLDLVLLLFVLGVAAIALTSRGAIAGILPAVSISAAGLLVVVLPFSAVVRLDGADVVGRKLLLFTLVLVWAGDTAAYFAGRGFGRMKMSPQLSPNKTWEGAAANLFGSLLVGALFGYWTNIPPVHMFAMAALGSIAGQVGDVFESACKRSAGVKDSGSILPGHGGVLDRIDALIFAAPVVWYYFEWIAVRAR